MSRVGFSIRLANDFDDDVQSVENGDEPLQDVQALFEGRKFVFESFSDHFQTEVQEMPQDFLQAQTLRTTNLGVFRGNQTRQIDVEIGLQWRVLVKIREHFVFVRVFLKR